MVGLFALALAASGALVVAAERTPVLIVPGDGGNQLEARIDLRHAPPHFFCRKRSAGWFTLWLQVTDLLPGEVDCWSDIVRLDFDRDTGRFSDAPGVETRVPGFGGTDTVEFLDPDLRSGSAYFHAFVEALAKRGYRRGVDVAAAPYDFRRSPASNAGYEAAVVALVEKLYERAGGKPVAIVSHSMGSLVVLYVLNQQPQEWKERFVHSWTSIAGVFAGSALEFKLHASGDNVGIAFVKSQSVVKEQRSYETNTWMMPRPGFWPADHVFLRSPARNYTVRDQAAFFRDVGYPDGAQIHNQTLALSPGLPAPGVPVHLMIGDGVPTPLSYIYTQGDARTWYHHDPAQTLTGDGDGTVNLQSLLSVHRKWSGEQPQAVTLDRFKGVAHTPLVSHGPLLRRFLARLAPQGGLEAAM